MDGIKVACRFLGISVKIVVCESLDFFVMHSNLAAVGCRWGWCWGFVAGVDECLLLMRINEGRDDCEDRSTLDVLARRPSKRLE